MKKRLLNKLTSGTYGVTPKMYKWFVQNNSKAWAKWYGHEFKHPINFSKDEQIKFIKKHTKRTIKQIKFLIRHFYHSCDEKSIYIYIDSIVTMQFDKSIFKVAKTKDYTSVLENVL